MSQPPFLDRLVEEYRTAYRAEGSPAIPVGGRLRVFLKRLDALYWREAEETVAAAVVPDVDSLRFEPERRFRLDSGLLDPRLVDNPDGRWVEGLRAELGEEGGSGIWTLSRWLSDRSQTFGLLLPVPEGGAGDAASPIHEERRRIYESLAPLLDHLPGIPAKVVDLMRAGRLDRMIQRLAPHVGADPRIREHHDKLRAIREVILRQARRRCTLRQQLALFDAITDLEEEGGAQAGASPVDGPRDAAAVDARRAFLVAELRLVRALLRLGAPGSGVASVHSVLAGRHPPVRRASLAGFVGLIHECDPRLPAPFRICIAPYTGTGFFEWDRDTLFVPLTPTRAEEDALLTAVGHYRLMIDSLQDSGGVRRRYEEQFGKSGLERRFLDDYRQWILGVGRGAHGALPEKTFLFFRDHVGPSAETLFAPADVRMLAPHEADREAEACRLRLQKGEGGAGDCYRLALLAWREGKAKAAFEHLARAVRSDRENGCYLFTLGYLCSLRGQHERAREAYQACLTRAPNTLWAVYAVDAIKRGE